MIVFVNYGTPQNRNIETAHRRIAHMVSSSYSWLPAHHLPVAATLAHADELIEQVGDLLIEYQAHNDDVFKLKEVRKGLVSQT